MDRDQLIQLLSPTGLALLDSLPPWDDDNTLATLTRLRGQGHSPALVSAVMTQSRLRARAEAKFGEFAGRMLFTEPGLEQATRLRVAAGHAGRFRQAGIATVADLGCGIGGDSLAFAGAGLSVTAVDADEITAAIATYNLAPFEQARVEHSYAEKVSLDSIAGIWLDPARRTVAGGVTTRLSRASDYSPSLDFAYHLAVTKPVGIKLGPGTDREVIPSDWEAQWVSVSGQVIELALWAGPLARPNVRRAALLLNNQGAHELTAPEDSPDAPVGPLGDYLYEPDGALIRARLIGELAKSYDGRMISDRIAYFTSENATHTPFATGFRIVDRLPLDERRLRQALQARGVGVVEIKKRGVDVDPAELRARLRLSGDQSATLILTRVGGKRIALLGERLERI